MTVFASRIYSKKILTVPVMVGYRSLLNWSCLITLTSNFFFFFLTTMNSITNSEALQGATVALLP